MKDSSTKALTAEQKSELVKTLKSRFEKNMSRHPNLKWESIETKLDTQPQKLWSLNVMETTGGEPDVVGFDQQSDEYIFFDCSEESPKGRRSLCYDLEGLESRKEFKPENNAEDMAKEMGIEILDEKQYRHLQNLGNFDKKTSSWLKTPPKIRKHGGSIFGDFRYEHVFIYHNGAQSYYAARGFRGCLMV